MNRSIVVLIKKMANSELFPECEKHTIVKNVYINFRVYFAIDQNLMVRTQIRENNPKPSH